MTTDTDIAGMDAAIRVAVQDAFNSKGYYNDGVDRDGIINHYIYRAGMVAGMRRAEDICRNADADYLGDLIREKIDALEKS